jgi:hypothetical protein
VRTRFDRLMKRLNPDIDFGTISTERLKRFVRRTDAEGFRRKNGRNPTEEELDAIRAEDKRLLSMLTTGELKRITEGRMDAFEGLQIAHARLAELDHVRDSWRDNGGNGRQ